MVQKELKIYYNDMVFQKIVTNITGQKRSDGKMLN